MLKFIKVDDKGRNSYGVMNGGTIIMSEPMRCDFVLHSAKDWPDRKSHLADLVIYIEDFIDLIVPVYKSVIGSNIRLTDSEVVEYINTMSVPELSRYLTSRNLVIPVISRIEDVFKSRVVNPTAANLYIVKKYSSDRTSTYCLLDDGVVIASGRRYDERTVGYSIFRETDVELLTVPSKVITMEQLVDNLIAEKEHPKVSRDKLVDILDDYEFYRFMGVINELDLKREFNNAFNKAVEKCVSKEGVALGRFKYVPRIKKIDKLGNISYGVVKDDTLIQTNEYDYYNIVICDSETAKSLTLPEGCVVINTYTIADYLYLKFNVSSYPKVSVEQLSERIDSCRNIQEFSEFLEDNVVLKKFIECMVNSLSAGSNGSIYRSVKMDRNQGSVGWIKGKNNTRVRGNRELEVNVMPDVVKSIDINIKKYELNGEFSNGVVENGVLKSSSFLIEDIAICDKARCNSPGFNSNNKCIVNTEDLANQLLELYNVNNISNNITGDELFTLLNDMSFIELKYFLEEHRIVVEFVNIMTEALHEFINKFTARRQIKDSNESVPAKPWTKEAQRIEFVKVSSDGTSTGYAAYPGINKLEVVNIKSLSPRILILPKGQGAVNPYKCKVLTADTIANAIYSKKLGIVLIESLAEDISCKSGEQFIAYMEGYSAVGTFIDLMNLFIKL